MDADQVVAALAALAQPTRLTIFRMLVACGHSGMSAGELAGKLGVSPANMSFHFRALSHAGLIASRQEGRFVYYTADFGAMNAMLAYLTENCCAGNPDACRLDNPKCQ